MKWHYYNVEKPALGQRVVFISQYLQAGKTVCELSEGIMHKEGIHKLIGGLIYSKGYVPENDITCWSDREEFARDLV